MDLKLVPVDTATVLKNFHYMTEGVESLLQYVPDRDWQGITQELLSGRLLTWMGFDNGKYIGFATTNIEHINEKLRIWWVVHTFIKIGANKDAFFEGIKIFEEKAKEAGCTWVKFCTSRDKAFERKLPHYKPVRTEFMKEV